MNNLPSGVYVIRITFIDLWYSYYKENYKKITNETYNY